MIIIINPLLDINECDENTDNCDSNADCSNTIGNFTCQCQNGFSGNGLTCSGEFYATRHCRRYNMQ